MSETLCVFRQNIRYDSGQEMADCGLLQQITGLAGKGHCQVTKSVCEQCVTHFPAKTFLHNPVLPSLLFNTCDAALMHTNNDARTQRLLALKNWAEQIILAEQTEFDAGVTHSSDTSESLPEKHAAYGAACDVVLCLNFESHSGAELEAAIQSVLNQSKVHPILHLISWDTAGKNLAQEYACWNVRSHHCLQPFHPLSACHQFADQLETPYVALQFPHCLSHHHRLATSLVQLIDEGADLVSSPVLSPSGLLFAQHPEPGVPVKVPVESLVFRRATFIDLGGVATDHPELGTEFILRALQGGCTLSLAVAALVTTTLSELLEQTEFRIVPEVESEKVISIRELRNQATGFLSQPVACDVVLPFHGHLDYTTEALESLLTQENAEVVIHLVDDATPGNEVVEFLNHWATHPQIRAYRNLRNLGQFTSFNNVSRYFETEFVAVQDADDISLPHRLSEAVNLLNQTGADFYGGAVELFGEEYVVTPTLNVHAESRQKRQSHRYSRYPRDQWIDYFIENPTAVFRVNMFREMGGYADFGNNLLNRASLDTEFLCRCRFSQIPFVVSREIVTRYRVHPNSATQNNLTGWGTGPRAQAARYVEKLFEKYSRSQFNPKQYGALGRYADATIKYD